MQVARTLAELVVHCARLRAARGRLALVPTMGALHPGHRALIQAAVATNAAVAASIFVNPLQFGPQEDLASYPRDEAADLALLRDAGCELVWMPDAGTMYPPEGATTIEVAGPALRWEGEFRPGHFRSVATVVAKLLGQVRPELALFGEKDWQQLQVVRRMVADLHLPHEILAVPTVREPDGLAYSSRNRNLDPQARAVAPLLHRVLRDTAEGLAGGSAAAPLLARAEARLREAGFAPDYVALVDGPTLAALDQPRPGSRLIAAARLGPVRLIDNIAAE